MQQSQIDKEAIVEPPILARAVKLRFRQPQHAGGGVSGVEGGAEHTHPLSGPGEMMTA
jgi:hypothetical protein